MAHPPETRRLQPDLQQHFLRMCDSDSRGLELAGTGSRFTFER